MNQHSHFKELIWYLCRMHWIDLVLFWVTVLSLIMAMISKMSYSLSPPAQVRFIKNIHLFLLQVLFWELKSMSDTNLSMQGVIWSSLLSTTWNYIIWILWTYYWSYVSFSTSLFSCSCYMYIHYIDVSEWGVHYCYVVHVISSAKH